MGQKNLPLASGAEHVSAFEQFGWTCRTKGNHFVLSKPGCPYNLSIPNHAEVKRALLQRQIKLAGISEDAYLTAFGR